MTVTTYPAALNLGTLTPAKTTRFRAPTQRSARLARPSASLRINPEVFPIRPYDITEAFPAVAEAFFGPDRTDPATWDEGNPTAYADQRPEVPALLMHGTADDMVPITFTEDFAAALTDGGHEVTTDYPEGADHLSVLDPAVAGPVIATWLGLS